MAPLKKENSRKGGEKLNSKKKYQHEIKEEPASDPISPI